MATQNLTKTTGQNLPSRDRLYIAYDDSLSGFGCRVTPNGVRRPAQIDVVRDLLTHAHIGTTQYYIRRDGIEASRAYAKRIGDIRRGR